MPTTTYQRNLTGGAFDLVIAAGDTADVVIRCTNEHAASVHFRITAGGPISAVGVRLGNEGNTTADVSDAAAAAAMTPIVTTRLYERGVDTSFIIFSLTSAAGASVHITPLPTEDIEPGTTYVDGQSVASAAVVPGKVAIYDTTGTNGVAVETAGTDAGPNIQNSLSVSARMVAWTGAFWARLTAATTIGDGVAIALNRLRVVSVEMAQNPAGTLDTLRSGLPAIDAIFTGLLGVAPVAKYDAAPPARADGQKGPLQAAANGSLLTGINDGLTQNNVAVETAGADAVSNTANALVVKARLKAYNATAAGGTWDRIRSGLITPTTVVTGFLNSIGVAFFNAFPTARTEGQQGPLQANSLGGLLSDLQTAIRGEDATNDLMAVAVKPITSATYSPTLSSTTDGATPVSAKASPGPVLSCYGHNTTGGNLYLQIHNKATAATAGNTAVISRLVPAGSIGGVGTDDFGVNGYYLSLGFSYAWSTAETTLTSPAAGAGRIEAFYGA